MPKTHYKPEKYAGPPKQEVIDTRNQYISPGVFTYYKDPVMIVDGHMQYLYNEKGEQYLDFLSGICSVGVGHGNPYVVAKTVEQVKTLQHATTIYLHPHLGNLAKKLAEKLPPGLDVAYITNSGSEANDYGSVQSTMGLTGLHTWKFNSPHGFGVKHVQNPDPYRNNLHNNLTEQQIFENSLESIKNTIHSDTPGKIAAFIHEPIQGAGGFLKGGDPAYMQEVYKTVRASGGLCIADEVQTGFGRTGENYWGFQNLGVQPDIITMAKSMGNGIPIGAVITRKEISATFKQKVHFNTFGGNPVSCAQAIASMEYIDNHKLQNNCKVVGDQLKKGLAELQKKYKIIGDLRGMGLMQGFEMVKDKKKTPATAEFVNLLEESKNNFVLIGKGGLYGNVTRFAPPMVVNSDDVKFLLHVLDKCLKQL